MVQKKFKNELIPITSDLTKSPLTGEYLPTYKVSQLAKKRFKPPPIYSVDHGVSKIFEGRFKPSTVTTNRQGVANIIKNLWFGASVSMRRNSDSRGHVKAEKKKKINEDIKQTYNQDVAPKLADYYSQSVELKINQAINEVNVYLQKSKLPELSDIQTDIIREKLIHKFTKTGIEYDKWHNNQKIGIHKLTKNQSLKNLKEKILADSRGVVHSAATSGRHREYYTDLIYLKTQDIGFGQRQRKQKPFKDWDLTDNIYWPASSGINYSKQAAIMIDASMQHLYLEAYNEAFKEAGYRFVRWVDRNDKFVCPICKSYARLVHIDPTKVPELAGLPFNKLIGIYPIEQVPYRPHPHCYSDDTEVYTNEGWKLFKDLNKNELFLSLNPENYDLVWVKANDWIKYQTDEPLVWLRNRSFDLAVTQDHKQLIEESDNGRFTKDSNIDRLFVNAVEIPKVSRIFRSSNWIGSYTQKVKFDEWSIDVEKFCLLMGYYLSEGNITIRDNDVKQIKISQSNDENRLKIYNDLKDISYILDGINELITVKIVLGKSAIYINDLILCNYVEQFGKSFEKFVPKEIKELCVGSIEIFLKAYNLGDDSIKKGKFWNGGQFEDSRNYCTSSKQMADDLGELILKIGKRPSFNKRECKGKEYKFKNGKYIINHDIWVINECKRQYTYGHRLKGNLVKYNGFVYCVTLDKFHTLLVRRNGKVTWSGNCRCHTIPVRFYKATVKQRGKQAVKLFADKFLGKYVSNRLKVGVINTIADDFGLDKLHKANMSDIAIDSLAETMQLTFNVPPDIIKKIYKVTQIKEYTVKLTNAQKIFLVQVANFLKERYPETFEALQTSTIVRAINNFLDDPLALKQKNPREYNIVNENKLKIFDSKTKEGKAVIAKESIEDSEFTEVNYGQIQKDKPVFLDERSYRRRQRTLIIQEELSDVAEAQLQAEARLLERSVVDPIAIEIAGTARKDIKIDDLAPIKAQVTLIRVPKSQIDYDIRDVTSKLLVNPKDVTVVDDFGRTIVGKGITKEEIRSELLRLYKRRYGEIDLDNFNKLFNKSFSDPEGTFSLASDFENILQDEFLEKDILVLRRRGKIEDFKDKMGLPKPPLKKKFNFRKVRRVTGRRIRGQTLRRSLYRELFVENFGTKVRGDFTADELAARIRGRTRRELERKYRGKARPLQGIDNIEIDVDEVQKILDTLTEADIDSVSLITRKTKKGKEIFEKTEEIVKLLNKNVTKEGISYNLPPESWDEWDKIRKGPLLKKISKINLIDTKVVSDKPFRQAVDIPYYINVLPEQVDNKTKLGKVFLQDTILKGKKVNTLVYDWDSGKTILTTKGKAFDDVTKFATPETFNRYITITYEKGALNFSLNGFEKLNRKQINYIVGSFSRHFETNGGWLGKTVNGIPISNLTNVTLEVKPGEFMMLFEAKKSLKSAGVADAARVWNAMAIQIEESKPAWAKLIRGILPKKKKS